MYFSLVITCFFVGGVLSACDQYCNSCSGCESAISSAGDLTTVCLTEDITTSGDSCVQFSGIPSGEHVTLDCQGFSIEATGSSYVVEFDGLSSTGAGTITGCTLLGERDQTIVKIVDKTNANVQNNIFKGDYSSLVRVEGSSSSSCTISGNLFQGREDPILPGVILPAKEGVYVDRSSSISITGNNFTTIDGTVILVQYTSSPTVIGNIIRDPYLPYKGIWMYGTEGGNVNGNTVSGGVYGMEITYVDSLQINGNIIEDASDWGLYVYSGDGVVLTGNHVLRNMGVGVMIAGHVDNCFLENNVIEYNHKEGVTIVTDSVIALSGNSISYNALIGVLIVTGVRVIMENNVLCGYQQMDIERLDQRVTLGYGNGNTCHNTINWIDDSSGWGCDNYCDSGLVCECTTCEECMDKMRDGACATITLLNDIECAQSISVSHGFNHKIFDCNGFTIEVDNDDDDHHTFTFVKGSTGSTIKNCVIQVQSASDVCGVNVFESRYINVLNNTFVGTLHDILPDTLIPGYSGIYLTRSTDCIVDGNRFREGELTSNAINEFYGERNTISNNIIFGTSTAIYNQYTLNTALHGNFISGSGMGFYAYDADSLVVSGNTIEKCTNGGIQISRGDVFLFSNNIIEFVTGAGLHISDTTNVLIESNTIERNVGDGIVLDTDGIVIISKNNSISYNAKVGILVTSGNNIIIKDSRICGFQQMDIEYLDGRTNQGYGEFNACQQTIGWTDDNTLVGCDLICEPASLCECNSCEQCVDMLSDTNCQEIKLLNDITCSEAISPTYGFNHKAMNCDDHHIFVDNDDPPHDTIVIVQRSTGSIIKNCVIHVMSDRAGIDIKEYSRMVGVLNNRFYGTLHDVLPDIVIPGRLGIYMGRSTDCLLDGNHFVEGELTEKGIEVYYGARNTISNNHIYGTTHGLFFQYVGYPQLIGNMISGCSQAIYMYDTDDVLLSGNTFEKCSSDFCVYVKYGVSFVMENNTIGNCTKSGLYIQYTIDVSMQFNHFSDNGGNGLVIYTDGIIALNGNTISNNALLGVLITHGTNVIMTDNTLCGFQQVDIERTAGGVNNGFGDGNTCQQTIGWMDDNSVDGCDHNCPSAIDCECTTCAECTALLSDPRCEKVKLLNNIYCSEAISPSFGFNHKSLDCDGHTIEVDNDDAPHDTIVIVDRSTGTIIENCIIKVMTGRTGINVGNSARYITILNNEFMGMDHPILPGVVEDGYHGIVAYYCFQCRFEANLFSFLSDWAIHASYGNEYSILRNEFLQTKGIYSYDADRNLFQGNSLSGGGCLFFQYSDNTDVLDNVIRGCSGIGVHPKACTGPIVANNTIEFSGSDGIRAEGVPDGVFENNTVNENNGNGINIWSSGIVHFKENNIHANGAAGIYVSSGNSYIFTDNIVCGYHPIDIQYGGGTNTGYGSGNSCDTVENWNDMASVGCSYSCPFSCVGQFKCAENAICVSENVCICEPEYNQNPTPYDSDGKCDPICDIPFECGEKAACIAPDTCECLTGYFPDPTPYNRCGFECDPLCGNFSVCIDNGPIPNTCECETGYYSVNPPTIPCIPICSSPVCPPHSDCVAPNECECHEFYDGPSCDPVCVDCVENADCVGPNVCECGDGYSGIGNSECFPECLSGCRANSHCTFPEICECDHGYFNVSGDCLPVCLPNCLEHSSCVSPDVCFCESGYSGNGTHQNPCVPECVSPFECGTNAICISPNLCDCEENFDGDPYSDLPLIMCQPDCDPACSNQNEECVIQDDIPVCQCKVGYAGYNCTPVCTPGLCKENAYCSAPESCLCDTGYSGDGLVQCDPICGSGCVSHASCFAPNTCVCDTGYQGDGNLECTPVCLPECENSVCIGPDLCDCLPGFAGAGTTVDPCIPQCTSPFDCGINSTCINPNECACIEGHKGDPYVSCGSVYCVDTCGQNAYCKGNPIGDDFCSCRTGFEGDPLAGCSPICTFCVPNSHCVAPEVCMCDTPDYYGDASVRCDPRCASDCIDNAYCSAPDTCSCSSGYGGDASVECLPICSSCIANSHCIAPEECECDSGWFGDSSVICNPICSSGCITNSHCSAPESCTCDSGYGGDASVECLPICSSCIENAHCVGPEECECDSGWFGDASTICNPICSTGCISNAYCSSPDTCTCSPGYSGDASVECFPICSSCIENSHCITPEVCECDSGWFGDSSVICNPICSSGCATNAFCSAPEECTCISGYTGDGDTSCLPTCSPNCHSLADCLSLNSCVCRSGYTGDGIVDCAPECSAGCGSNAICSEPGTCACLDGFEGNPYTGCTSICSTECGTHAHCVNGNCECLENYSGDPLTVCSPICNPVCGKNAACVAPDTCVCSPLHHGDPLVQCDPLCSPICGTHEFCEAPNICSCDAGYSRNLDGDCDVVCLEECPENSMCTLGQNHVPVCLCEQGYIMYRNKECFKEDCDFCENGICVTPTVCLCDEGWTGRICNKEEKEDDNNDDDSESSVASVGSSGVSVASLIFALLAVFGVVFSAISIIVLCVLLKRKKSVREEKGKREVDVELKDLETLTTTTPTSETQVKAEKHSESSSQEPTVQQEVKSSQKPGEATIAASTEEKVEFELPKFEPVVKVESESSQKSAVPRKEVKKEAVPVPLKKKRGKHKKKVEQRKVVMKESESDTSSDDIVLEVDSGDSEEESEEDSGETEYETDSDD